MKNLSILSALILLAYGAFAQPPVQTDPVNNGNGDSINIQNQLPGNKSYSKDNTTTDTLKTKSNKKSPKAKK